MEAGMKVVETETEEERADMAALRVGTGMAFTPKFWKPTTPWNLQDLHCSTMTVMLFALLWQVPAPIM